MITIRVILPQFTVIGHNRHRNGHKKKLFNIARSCAPLARFGAALASSNFSGLILSAFQRPGIVAKR